MSTVSPSGMVCSGVLRCAGAQLALVGLSGLLLVFQLGLEFFAHLGWRSPCRALFELIEETPSPAYSFDER